MGTPKNHTNLLALESSPYLLQHAHNPVNWQNWNEAAWAQAVEENKLVLISIGYSACHWCHVMEHESFEDEAVAEIMNKHFVCIKVDREERPDVDQIYMTAVQLMTGHGGWPLNCFATPDARPVYGGTYFRKEQWINILGNLSDLWKTEPGKVYEYAEQLTEGVKKSELIGLKKEHAEIEPQTLLESWMNWEKRIDHTQGGPNKAPKFPLPNNYLFLLQLGQASFVPPETRQNINNHAALTLRKMAWGGIYDQLGGGFARYATDSLWKVPHFEKMLYDNAQLCSLYTEAYLLDPLPLYKQTVYETLGFVQRELTSAGHVFYSALDADSEGVEGKYYVWTEDELRRLTGTDFELFAAYYSVNKTGFWEHDNYILLRSEEEQVLCKRFGLGEDELRLKINRLKTTMLAARGQRVRPGLDDKSLLSWNALMLKAYADAYRVFAEPRFLVSALNNAALLVRCFLKPDGSLFHSYKNGKPTINGFLEDYCFTIEAFLALYQVTFDETWIGHSAALCEYTLAHFYDSGSGLFFFTSSIDPPLISRKYELSDNVIPASNSSMAHVLFQLGQLLGKTAYTDLSKRMLMQVQPEIVQYGAGYSNWALLQLRFTQPLFEIAIVGKAVDEIRAELQQHASGNLIFAGSAATSLLPLLAQRHKEGETLIYICREQTCFAPVTTVKDALRLLTTKYES